MSLAKKVHRMLMRRSALAAFSRPSAALQRLRRSLSGAGRPEKLFDT
jgi:hypothetical protein